MAHIYMDESGDLGFNPKKKNSNYFVVTFLFVNNKRPIEKVIRKVHASLRKSKKKKVSVLHASKETPQLRRKLLVLLSKEDCVVMAIVIDKSKIHTKFQDEKHVLYNYVVNILLDKVLSSDHIDKRRGINFIASQRETSKVLNENFITYLTEQVKQNHSIDLSVKIIKPHADKLLQAVDFVSWSMFRKYELGDDTYHNYIKDRVVEEKQLFD